MKSFFKNHPVKNESSCKNYRTFLGTIKRKPKEVYFSEKLLGFHGDVRKT